jgi:hypothetical protein
MDDWNWWDYTWTVSYTTPDGGATDTFNGNLGVEVSGGCYAADWVVDPIPNYLNTGTWKFPPAVPKVIDDWWDIWGEMLHD